MTKKDIHMYSVYSLVVAAFTLFVVYLYNTVQPPQYVMAISAIMYLLAPALAFYVLVPHARPLPPVLFKVQMVVSLVMNGFIGWFYTTPWVWLAGYLMFSLTAIAAIYGYFLCREIERDIDDELADTFNATAGEDLEAGDCVYCCQECKGGGKETVVKKLDGWDCV